MGKSDAPPLYSEKKQNPERVGTSPRSGTGTRKQALAITRHGTNHPLTHSAPNLAGLPITFGSGHVPKKPHQCVGHSGPLSSNSA